MGMMTVASHFAASRVSGNEGSVLSAGKYLEGLEPMSVGVAGSRLDLQISMKTRYAPHGIPIADEEHESIYSSGTWYRRNAGMINTIA